MNAHACGNCEGVDHASCLMNPDRPVKDCVLIVCTQGCEGDCARWNLVGEHQTSPPRILRGSIPDEGPQG